MCCIDRGSLSEYEARRMFRQMVSAVDHLHQMGVVHRDLKLENILLNTDMNVKIIGDVNYAYSSNLWWIRRCWMRTLENIGVIFSNAQICFLNGMGSPNSGRASRKSLDWSKLAAINFKQLLTLWWLGYFLSILDMYEACKSVHTTKELLL